MSQGETARAAGRLNKQRQCEDRLGNNAQLRAARERGETGSEGKGQPPSLQGQEHKKHETTMTTTQEGHSKAACKRDSQFSIGKLKRKLGKYGNSTRDFVDV